MTRKKQSPCPRCGSDRATLVSEMYMPHTPYLDPRTGMTFQGRIRCRYQCEACGLIDHESRGKNPEVVQVPAAVRKLRTRRDRIREKLAQLTSELAELDLELAAAEKK